MSFLLEIMDIYCAYMYIICLIKSLMFAYCANTT